VTGKIEFETSLGEEAREGEKKKGTVAVSGREKTESSIKPLGEDGGRGDWKSA